MAKAKRTSVEDKRTPRHSNDAKRPSKTLPGKEGGRDAATVRACRFCLPVVVTRGSLSRGECP